MHTTKSALLSALSFSLSFSLLTANIANSNTSEDFGPYSSNPSQEAQKHLQALGDWTESETSIEAALSNFYRRTNLPVSDDPIQQLLDIDTVASAEREANRILDGDSSDSMQAYAYTIAPWLKTPAVADDSTKLALLADQTQDAATTLSSNEAGSNETDNQTDNDAAVVTPVNEMLAERSALTAAISSLNNVLKNASDAVDTLY